MSLYGYPKETTPFIDSLAKESVVFTNAISVSSWTLPSAMSFFTSAYPSRHKILNKYTISENGQVITNLNNLSPNLVTTAEALKNAGYQTGGFTGGAALDSQFGFNKGFDTYKNQEVFGGLKKSIPQALEWINQNKENKFFVFIHGYDTHGQYEPEGGYNFRFSDSKYKGRLSGSKDEQKELREQGVFQGHIFLTGEDVSFLTSIYDEKLNDADRQIADFFSQYQKLNINDKTMFIIVSNHGDELYEHGRIDHGHSLYDELIKIPLIIKIPGLNEERIISSQVRNIDIMPTILDLIGLDKDSVSSNNIDGASLLPLLNGAKMNVDVFPETDYRYSSFLRSIRTYDNWKLILNLENGEKEMYQLEKDPGEKHSLINSSDKQLVSKQQELEQLLFKHFDNYGGLEKKYIQEPAAY